MKVQQLLIFVTVLMLTVGCNKQTNSDPVNQKPETESNSSTEVAQKTGTKSAVFIEDKEPIEGTIKFIQKQGKQYIEFQSDFKTKEGPDLFVLLHKQEKPSSYNQKDYVKLGALQKVNGQQIYEIPPQLNLKDFNSVVIWCKKFNVTFGHAVIVK